jgi:putative ABC transport system permease protein
MKLIHLLRTMFRKDELNQQLTAELNFHLEKQIEQNLAAGMSHAEARYAALRRFGGVEQVKEECRDAWGVRLISALFQDIRFGFRMLAKNPGFTVVAVLTLALGIGANTAIFSVVNAALLRSLPYNEPGRLVYVWAAEKARGIPRSPASIPDLRDWSEQNRVFDGMTGWWSGSYNLAGGDEPRRVTGRVVSTNFFDVLGVHAGVGRTFTAETGSSDNDHVIVLSHALWTEAFGGNRSILGRTIALDNQPYTVIGVMPAEFSSPEPDVQLWIPWPLDAQAKAARGERFLGVLARLKPGVSKESAQADMTAIALRLSGQYEEDKGVTTYLVPAQEQITGNVRQALWILLAAVGLVLLIACANLANLLLARSAAREREFAVRTALGAERSRLVRQSLTESLLLSLLGGVVGMLLAVWGMGYLRVFAAHQIPRAQDIGIDFGVLGFTLGVTLLTGVLSGLFPALSSYHGKLADFLKEGTRGLAGGRRRRLRSVLAVSEVAFALMLLVGAGLLVESFRRLHAVKPGFNPDRVLTCAISLPESKYNDPRIVSFFAQLLERVRALPGVVATGATMTLPLQNPNGGYWTGLNVEGRPVATRESIPVVSLSQVTPGYFSAIGIPILKGRLFSEQDNISQSSKVAIINATIARRHFAGIDPVGRRIRFGESDREPWITVVGVVGDAALQSLADPRFPQVYVPHGQGTGGGPAGNMELVLRTASDPLTLAKAVRMQVHEIDKDQSVADLRTLDQVLSVSLAQPRMNTLLLGGFAALALVLAIVGLYGVMAYSVAQRAREIGIRMALGAGGGAMLRMIVKQGMILALAGVGIGLVGALGLTRFMASLLYGVRPTDPWTLLVVSFGLLSVAAIAAYIPARRAIKVDPMVALREE